MGFGRFWAGAFGCVEGWLRVGLGLLWVSLAVTGRLGWVWDWFQVGVPHKALSKGKHLRFTLESAGPSNGPLPTAGPTFLETSL